MSERERVLDRQLTEAREREAQLERKVSFANKAPQSREK